MVRSSRHQLLLAFLVVFTLSLAAGQTFQYSRGWTNGRKRSDPSLGVRRVGVAELLSTPPRLFAPPQQQAHPSSHILPKTMDERLDALEAGLNALLKASSAGVSPGGEDEYYAEK
ncbi:uncharacterized protein Crz isoform X2 [Panulirus ornatus]